MRNAGEWADAERHEPAFAARGGDWQTGYLPYWWGPLEAASDYRTRQITVVAASQTGKTANVILSILGHRFADGPRVPTTLVFPTQKAVTDFSGDRLQRLIETTPSLDRIHEKGKRDARYLKFLGGVPVRLAWSGSSTELASNPAGLALVDEIDRMVKDVGGEGDPLTLIRARLITYHLHLLVVCSSPTIADVSPIQREFDSGSMEIAEWPCQQCGEFFRPVSEHIRFPERCSPQQAEEKARYVCPKCGVEHTEKDKLQMMRGMRWWGYERDAAGRYKPREDGDQVIDYTHRSFWVPGLLSGYTTFGGLARDLRAAQMSNEPSVMQGCLNTKFGELFEIVGERPELDDIAACRDEYTSGDRVDAVQRVTMGVDCQRDRLVWMIVGWGAEEMDLEAWVIEAGEVHGNPLFDEVWIELHRIIVDIRYGIQMTLIDAGWDPGTTFVRPYERIKAFCRQHESRQVFPSRGRRRLPTPVQSRREDLQMGGRKIKNAVLEFRVDTVHFKSAIYARVQVSPGDPRGLHLPYDISDDVMRQIVSEELRTTPGGEVFYHCPRHRPNHQLDALVLAYAAAYQMDMTRRLRRRGPTLDLAPPPPMTKARAPNEPINETPARARRRPGRRGMQRRGLV